MELKDYIEKVKVGFIKDGWIIVHSYGQSFSKNDSVYIFSSLVDSRKVSVALKDYTWDIHYGYGRPEMETYSEGGNNISKYYRFMKEGFEPLIYNREDFGTHKDYLELSEEFRLYHNLYEEFNSHKDKKYYFVDSNGDDILVAKINDEEVSVKLKFLRDYISAKGMDFFVYFDIRRDSNKSISDLNLEPLNRNYSTDKYIYNHVIDIHDFPHEDMISFSQIMGKTLIKKKQEYNLDDHNKLFREDKYEDFLIGYSEDGEELLYTSNENFLSNNFGKNPDSPHYLTPIFFKKDVLKRYYDNPSKYSVQDGIVYCGNMWSLKIDNSCREHVNVFLGDLGKLNYKEQLYWKSYNFLPEKRKLSKAAYERAFNGKFCNPDSSDLYLKMLYSSFNEEWENKYGWKLFKPLCKEDEHYFKSLHLLTTTSNEKEFEEQVLALTKIFIDSLNEIKLVIGLTLNKPNAKGIDKLEEFLKGKDIKIEDMMKFFRNLQQLRSSVVAHRKSMKRKDTKKVQKYFGYDTKSLEEILEDIFNHLINSLNTLKKACLK